MRWIVGGKAVVGRAASPSRFETQWLATDKNLSALATCPANGSTMCMAATLATPEPIKDWSLTSLKEKLIKIGAKVVSHGRYVVFQIAEVAIPPQMFQEILRLIAELRPQPPPAPA